MLGGLASHSPCGSHPRDLPGACARVPPPRSRYSCSTTLSITYSMLGSASCRTRATPLCHEAARRPDTVKELVCRLHLGCAPSGMAQRIAQLDDFELGFVDFFALLHQLPQIFGIDRSPRAGWICISSGTITMKCCLSWPI